MNFKEYDDSGNYIFNENKNISINERFNDSKDINKANISLLQRKTKRYTKYLILEETRKIMSIRKKEDESSNNNNKIYAIFNKNTKFEKVKEIEHHIDAQDKNKDKNYIKFEDKIIQTDESVSEK